MFQQYLPHKQTKLILTLLLLKVNFSSTNPLIIESPGVVLLTFKMYFILIVFSPFKFQGVSLSGKLQVFHVLHSLLFIFHLFFLHSYAFTNISVLAIKWLSFISQFAHCNFHKTRWKKNLMEFIDMHFSSNSQKTHCYGMTRFIALISFLLFSLSVVCVWITNTLFFACVETLASI